MTLEEILLSLVQRVEKLERASAQKIMWGTVAEIDFAAARARIEIRPGVRTPLIPWISAKAGANSAWTPPEIGEQVLVFLPNGAEFSGGVFLTGIYSKNFPAHENRGNVFAQVFADGARIDYDTDAHTLKAVLPDGSSAELTATSVAAHCTTARVEASESITLDTPETTATGNVNIDGNLTVNGNATLNADATVAGTLTVAGIVMNTHTHVGNLGAPTSPPM